MNETVQPFWRSLLYIPANNERFLAKAHLRGADGIILDLEDSIPFSEKPTARERCRTAIGKLQEGSSDILVRINGSLRLAASDLEAVVQPGVKAILLPKCETPGHAIMVSGAIAEIEQERNLPHEGIGLIPVVESTSAYFRCQKIASSTTRNVALLLGNEDFATDAGIDPSSETMLLPKQQIAFAAKSAGLLALGLLDTIAEITDLDRTLEAAIKSAKFGFEGATCVHPDLVPILNKAFTPSEEAIAHAREILTTFQEAQSQGIGAIRVRGRMVDAPIVQRAEKLIARFERLAHFSENDRI